MNEIQLNLLPMKEGDCIHLRFGRKNDWHNIVIDSGPAGCAWKFRKLMKEIEKREEIIELLCFTHIDDDHIKGAERVLSSPTFDTGIIKEVWLNLPPEKTEDTEKNSAYTPATVESACVLWRAIAEQGLPCRTCVKKGQQVRIGDAEVQVLLPTEERLQHYMQYWDAEMEKLQEKGRYLPLSGWREDDSPTNGASITLLISIDDKKLLFAGDAFPGDLEVVCRENIDGGVNVMKLPHHGSAKNITLQMIEAAECRHFLISTEQNQYRPSRETMEILSGYGKNCGGIKVYGNYEWPEFKEGFDGMEIIALEDSDTPDKLEGIVIFSE